MTEHTDPPTDIPMEITNDTINSYPDAREYDGPELGVSEAREHDIAGPSNTFIPENRPLSPPLPNLNTKSFPFVDADSDDSDDEDDYPIATLPIYLSTALMTQGGGATGAGAGAGGSSNLDLYQYPLQHKSLNVPTWARDRGKEISSRIKENCKRIEIEIPVDAGSNYWREEKAKDLGFVPDTININGDEDIIGGYGFNGGNATTSSSSKKDKGKKEKSSSSSKGKEKWGDKMRLRSEPVPNATGYYSGIIRDGALHLHPISKLHQFRTSMGYLDDADDKAKERSSRRANGMQNGGDSDDDSKKKAPPPAIRQQQQQQQRKLLDEDDNDGSGSIKDFRNKMWWMSKKENEDQWVQYKWKSGEDDDVIQTLDKLVVTEDRRERLTCKTRPLDFLDRQDKMQLV